MELSERKQKILGAIVEQYIKTGEPVGSKALLSALDMSVSSATVRNEMAELSAMGYLEQPHTSAGRIPTNEGYRYYVDHLMVNRQIDESLRRRIEAGVHMAVTDPEKLLQRAGEVLADLTDCAAVSTTPSGEGAFIKRVEIVPVGTRTAMIVLLTSTGVLKSKVCRSDSDLNASVLESFYNIMKASFIGTKLEDVDTAMMQKLAASFGADVFTLLPLVTAVSDLAQESIHTDIVLGGQSNLLHYSNYYGNTAYELLEFLRRGEPISKLLSSAANGEKDVDVKIGSENPYKQLTKSSVIVSNYNIDGNRRGSIGIIGPTRIDYEKLIPSVKYLTDLVGKLLTQTFKDE